ncbi:MAG TPA: bile acid:sodium symporter [Prolixibacteraceae bacterium]|nr:bile acid:sodium symporter [Prolixibacteraceae bacterium]
MEIISHSYIDILISVVLAAIMFGLGLSLTFANFKNVLLHPKAFFVGLGAQMLFLPSVAFIIMLFSNLPNEFKVGIMILAVCPGGTTSGFVTYLFKGNVALSIALTVINSILTLFTIPLVVNLALRYFMGREAELHLPILESITQMFLITLLPAFIGVMVRTFKPAAAEVMQKPVKYIMIVLLALVYLIKFFAGDEHGGSGITFPEMWSIFPYVLIFNVVCFVFSIFIGKVAKLSIRDAFTIAIEVALHNTTLALLIAGTLLQNQEMAKPALLYSLFSFWTALIFGLIMLKFYKKQFNENK